MSLFLAEIWKKKKDAFSSLPLLSNTVIENNHVQAVKWSQYLPNHIFSTGLILQNVNMNTVASAKMPVPECSMFVQIASVVQNRNVVSSYNRKLIYLSDIQFQFMMTNLAL